VTEQRQHARERGRNIAVGLTALGGLIGLVLLLTAFGYVPAVLRSGYDVTLYMEDSAGLRVNSRVTLWGSQIGEVKEVGFAEPGQPGRVYVRLRIEEAYEIPSDVQVRVETPLFGGGPEIAMVGSEPGGPTLAKDGNAQLSSVTIVDPLRQLEAVSQHVGEMKETWVGVGDNINMLFGDPEGEEGVPSLPRVVLSLEERLDQLDAVFANAQEWLGNEELRDDVTTAAANARELTETLNGTVASLEARYVALADAAEEQLNNVGTTLDNANQALANTAEGMEQVQRRYIALANDAAHVVSSIDELVAQAGSDDSTLGLLLNDPQLYHNLTDTSERMRIMIDEATLLIEKWEAEGLPLRVFD